MVRVLKAWPRVWFFWATLDGEQCDSVKVFREHSALMPPLPFAFGWEECRNGQEQSQAGLSTVLSIRPREAASSFTPRKTLVGWKQRLLWARIPSTSEKGIAQLPWRWEQIRRWGMSFLVFWFSLVLGSTGPTGGSHMHSVRKTPQANCPRDLLLILFLKKQQFSNFTCGHVCALTASYKGQSGKNHLTWFKSNLPY